MQLRPGGAKHGVKAFSALSNTQAHAFAADHLKSAPLGSGHVHLMNRSNVHAPSQTNHISISGVTDPETAMRDLGWHQKRLWSGLTPHESPHF